MGKSSRIIAQRTSRVAGALRSPQTPIGVCDLNPKLENRNPKPELRNPKPETRDPKPKTRNPQAGNCDPNRLDVARLPLAQDRAAASRAVHDAFHRTNRRTWVPRPETRNPNPGTKTPSIQNSQSRIPTPKPDTRNLKPDTRNLKPESRIPIPKPRNPKHLVRCMLPPFGCTVEPGCRNPNSKF